MAIHGDLAVSASATVEFEIAMASVEIASKRIREKYVENGVIEVVMVAFER